MARNILESRWQERIKIKEAERRSALGLPTTEEEIKAAAKEIVQAAKEIVKETAEVEEATEEKSVVQKVKQLVGGGKGKRGRPKKDKA